MSKIIFLDIETVPEYENLMKAPPEYIIRWEKFWTVRNKESKIDLVEAYALDAAYSSEFGKICTIGLGKEGKLAARTSDDEQTLLGWLFDTCENNSNHALCAHSGKTFDFPFIIRRAIFSNMLLPKQFKIGGVKPWDMALLDTQSLYNCGNYWQKIKLDLLCYKLGIDSPKDIAGTDGSNVTELFYSGDFKAINEYCKADVRALELVYLRLVEIDSIYIQ